MDTKGLSVADVMTTHPVDRQGKLVGTISHAHLAAHRFSEVDRAGPETGSTPTEQTD